MRTITSAQRAQIAAAARAVFAKFEVQNPDGVWTDVTTGLSTPDWLNAATLTESIDQAAQQFTATLLRDAGTLSLAPLRTDSTLNRNAAGSYAPLLDLRRMWRAFVGVAPAGSTAPTIDSASNVFTSPRDFTNAAWAKNNTTLTANSAVGPDNLANSAAQLYETAATGYHEIERSITGTAGQKTALEYYVKAGTRTIAAVWAYDNATFYTGYVDLVSGSVLTAPGGGDTLTMTPMGAGWWRLTFIHTHVGASVNYSIACAQSNGVNSYAGDTTKGIQVWGAQAELNAAAPSFHMSDWVEIGRGYIDAIDVQGDPQGSIVVTGRDLMAPILDGYIKGDNGVPYPPYSPNGTDSMETVIQQLLDDTLGTGRANVGSSGYTLYTPVSPGFTITTPYQAGVGKLGAAIQQVAQLAGCVVRMVYDANNVPRLTLLTPPRNATAAQWTLGPSEYTALPTAALALAGVRTLIDLYYQDGTGQQRVSAPAPKTGTVTATNGAATFSVSQAGVLANGDLIVVGAVGYTVSAFNGTTSCTLSGNPTFAASPWTTSDSLTKYGIRYMRIDLAPAYTLTAAKAQAMADAIGSDLGTPWLTQQIVSEALWFAQLYDYGTAQANGVHYNTDQTGGVTRVEHAMAGGTVMTTLGLRGQPAGGYRTWLTQGQSAPPVGPNLVVTPSAGASSYAIAWSGNNVTLAINGGAYGTPPASPITVARPAAGSADTVYAFQGTLNGQTVTDSVTIPAIGAAAGTVTPDLTVTPGTMTASAMPFTVSAVNPSGGAAPGITVTLHGTTGTNTTTSTAIAADTATTVASGDVVTVTRPAFNSAPASATFRAAMSGGGAETIQRTILNQDKTSFGPNLQVNATPGPTSYTITWSGDGVTVSINGGAYAAPAASPITVTRNPSGGADQTYTFSGTKDGVAITNTVSIPAISGSTAPSNALTPSLTNNQLDDTTDPVTLSASATNLPAAYSWAIYPGYSAGQYSSTAQWSGSNSVSPLPFSASVSPGVKRSQWYKLVVTVGADTYAAECQVQGLLAFIDGATGHPLRGTPYTDGGYATRALDTGGYTLHSGVTDSGGSRAINRFFAKGLSSDPDTLDGAPDGTTYGRPLLARLSGGKPWIDFAEGIHANKVADYIGTGSTYRVMGIAESHQNLAPNVMAYSTQFNLGSYYNTPLATMGLSVGDVLSFSGLITNRNGTDTQSAYFHLTFLDSNGTTISEVTAAAPSTSSTSEQAVSAANVTIPANTATIQCGSTTTRPGGATGRRFMLNRGPVAIPFTDTPLRLNRDTADVVADGSTHGITTLTDRTNLINSLDASGVLAGKVVRARGFDDGYYAIRATDTVGYTIHSGVTDSGGARAVNRFYAKGIASDPDSADAFAGHDGVTNRVPTLNEATGGGRGYAAIDSTNIVVPGAVDFARGYTNKHLGNIPDDSGSSRFAVSNIDANRRALIDLTQAHLGKSLANIPDDSGSARYAVAAVDPNRRAIVDFNAAHVNKTTDYIGDGAGSPLAGGKRGAIALSTGNRLVTGVDSSADLVGAPVAAVVNGASTSLYRETFDTDPVANGRMIVVAGPNPALDFGVGTVGPNAVQVTTATWLRAAKLTPYNPARLYRIRARVRQSADGTVNNPIYLGVQCYDAAGNAANNNSGNAYICINGSSPVAANGWLDAVGYFKGASVPYASGSPGPSTDGASPTALSVNTVSIAPMILFNWTSGNGTQECDYIEIDVLDEDLSARGYNALASGGQQINPGITQQDSVTPRVMMRGYQVQQLAHGAAITFSPAYGAPPKYRITGGIKHEPRSVWGATGSGSEAAAVNASLPQIEDYSLLSLGTGGATVRARLRQPGSTTPQSDAWTGTTSISSPGAVTSNRNPAEGASADGNYTATGTLAMNIGYDPSIGGVQSLSVTVALDVDVTGTAGFTEVNTMTGSLSSSSGNRSSSVAINLAYANAGLSASSLFRLRIKTESNPQGTGTYTATASALQYNTATGDQYASATNIPGQTVTIETWIDSGTN